jgi:hypothetical protein
MVGEKGPELVNLPRGAQVFKPVKRGECWEDQSGPAVVMQNGVLGVAAELVDWPLRRYDLRHGTDQKADRLPRL